MTERRTARRYDLCLSASVRAPSGTGSLEQQGTTRDVSTRGVYLILDRAVSKEVEVGLTMVLPTDMSGTASVFVRAVGKVVRVEEWSHDGADRIGVATMIRRYEIVRSEPAASVRASGKSL